MPHATQHTIRPWVGVDRGVERREARSVRSQISFLDSNSSVLPAARNSNTPLSK